ncbi:hypothetical protein [Pedobacter nyackensis]|nr:hypothetical protein [Pedobacter nyackensis]
MIKKVNRLHRSGGLSMLSELDRLMKKEEQRVLKTKQKALKRQFKETGGE